MSDLTLADRLNALTKRLGGYWTRTRLPNQSDVVRLHLEGGDVLAGSGATTADAVAALEAKVTANLES